MSFGWVLPRFQVSAFSDPALRRIVFSMERVLNGLKILRKLPGAFNESHIHKVAKTSQNRRNLSGGDNDLLLVGYPYFFLNFLFDAPQTGVMLRCVDSNASENLFRKTVRK